MKSVKIKHFADCEDFPSAQRMGRKIRHGGKIETSPCGKKRLSMKEAKKVVRLARYDRVMRMAQGLPIRRREIRWYACAACASYHTTSKKDRMDVVVEAAYGLIA
jgi:hypothetical protein